MMFLVVWELLLQYHEKQKKPIIFLTHFRMIFFAEDSMIDGYKELTPVIYGENAIKYLYTEQKKAEGKSAFAALARPDGAGPM